MHPAQDEVALPLRRNALSCLRARHVALNYRRLRTSSVWGRRSRAVENSEKVRFT
jgi:hypothetical protein